MTLPEVTNDNTMELLTMASFNATTSSSQNTPTTTYHGGTINESAWNQHRELILGVAICGTVLIFSCIGLVVMVVLYIRARKRERIGSERTDGSEEANNCSTNFKIIPRRRIFRKSQAGSASDLLSGGSSGVHGIHMAVVQTGTYSASLEKEHSYAYISSDLINPDPRPPVKCKPPTLPPDRITVRQNPCYSVTPAASTEDLTSETVNQQRTENVYDLPVLVPLPRQVCEYEVPVASSPTSTPGQVRAKERVNELTGNNEYVELD